MDLMELLKALFGDKPLTFTEFETALQGNKDIKLGNLASGNYIDKEKFKAKEDEIKTLTSQIGERDKDIEALKASTGDTEALNKTITELQTKYETATKDFTKQIEDRDYSSAINNHLTGIEFTSNSAKEAFISKVTTSGLKNDGGKLMGFDDYLTKYKTEDAGAFVAPKNDEPPTPPAPSFIRPAGNTSVPANNPFSFGFTGVRKPPEEK